jgi:hypothetical protein
MEGQSIENQIGNETKRCARQSRCRAKKAKAKAKRNKSKAIKAKSNYE